MSYTLRVLYNNVYTSAMYNKANLEKLKWLSTGYRMNKYILW